jgi:hypothetical protein
VNPVDTIAIVVALLMSLFVGWRFINLVKTMLPRKQKPKKADSSISVVSGYRAEDSRYRRLEIDLAIDGVVDEALCDLASQIWYILEETVEDRRYLEDNPEFGREVAELIGLEPGSMEEAEWDTVLKNLGMLTYALLAFHIEDTYRGQTRRQWVVTHILGRYSAVLGEEGTEQFFDTLLSCVRRTAASYGKPATDPAG